MATDKKSDYVGNHGGAYIDNDGQSKQFTYVNHDVKTSIAAKVLTEEEKSNIKSELSQYRERLIEKILSLPASLAPDLFWNFTIRGEKVDKIEWNETVLRDPAIPIEILRDMNVLISNRMSIKLL